jgi:hypothetical protein
MRRAGRGRLGILTFCADQLVAEFLKRSPFAPCLGPSLGGGGKVTVDAPVDRIPVFTRGDATVPLRAEREI